jgi:hypothetical protein
MNVPPKIAVEDPDHVPETFVAGPFNISIIGELAYLTYFGPLPDGCRNASDKYRSPRSFAGPVSAHAKAS